MGKQDEIRAALKGFASTVGPAPTILATVRSVDESSFTCVLVDDDGNVIPDVRLRPVLDGSESVTLVPAVDAWALAVRIENDEEWMLIAAGVITKTIVKIGTTTLQQTANGFEIKKGTASLKNILTNIIQATQQILVIYGNNPDYTKLTNALTDTNNLFS
jgi:hypothetical protein